ncbi:hypothetical protein MNBD_GAMMA16-1906 [hydrothermal vent metagenome]|uniref:Dienelactone hydrolase domain-containing protein n=1 Tax=hydrothermal vent metagenome TaxID=652676 RepID=A0A3B0ZD63_9ZZZZ
MFRGLIYGLILGFSSVVWAEAEVKAVDDSGKIITLTTAIGTTLDAYIAGSVATKKSVLILHDRWGLDQTARLWADRFAAEGYLALAIDLYDGRAAKKTNSAHAALIMRQIDPEWSTVNIKAGLNYLSKKTGEKTAVLGWGLGGSLAFKATQLNTDILASAVMMYGYLPIEARELEKVTSPILGVFSTSDERITPEEIEQVGFLMGKLRKPFVSLNVDAAAGFVDESLPAYDQEVMELAWQRSLEFLNATL